MIQPEPRPTPVGAHDVACRVLIPYAAGERDFPGEELRGACFDEAVLTDANLQGADLTGATFRRAVLERADLTAARGLLPRAFAGADLRGARLPASLKEFEADLTRARQLADSAQKLFLGILGGCAYTVLTVSQVTDPQLMFPSVPAELPIVRVPVPTVEFFWAVPWVLAAVFIYFHLYLQRLWETLAGLPARLPDGAAVDERVDPWLINGLIRRHALRLRATGAARAPLLSVQDRACTFAAWWVAPLALLPLWHRYLTRHDWAGTGLHIAAIALMALVAWNFRQLARATMRGDTRPPCAWWRLFRRGRTYWVSAIGLAALWTLLFLSFAGIEGGTFAGDHPYTQEKVRRAIEFFAENADLFQAEAWPRPSTWKGTDEEVRLAKAVEFSGRDFRGANLRSAFLVSAIFSDAHLENADLSGADLRQATIRANLKRARLVDAKLRGATVTAGLWWADLSAADLQDARLHGASLQGAVLAGANLRGAELHGATLFGADLTRADLRGANLIDARCVTAEMVEVALVDETTVLPALPAPCDQPDRIPPMPRPRCVAFFGSHICW